MFYIGPGGKIHATSFRLCTVAAALFARLTGVIGPLSVALYLGLFGVGSGLFTSPNNSAIMGAMPRHRLGIAGSVLVTTRNTGMVLCIMTGGAVLTAGQAAYGVSAALSLAGALITLLGKEARDCRAQIVPVDGVLDGRHFDYCIFMLCVI